MMPVQEKNNSHVHYRYLILFLILSLIILLSVIILSSGDRFLSHLSVASTIISIVLGCLAIIYAYISNMSLSASISSVEKTTKSLEDLAFKLSSIEDTVKSSIANAKNLGDKLDIKIEKFTKEIDVVQTISQELSRYSESISTATAKIPEFKNELDEFKNNFLQDSTSKSLFDEEDFSFITKVILLFLNKIHKENLEIDAYDYFGNTPLRRAFTLAVEVLEFTRQITIVVRYEDSVYLRVESFKFKVNFNILNVKNEACTDYLHNEDVKKVIDKIIEFIEE